MGFSQDGQRDQGHQSNVHDISHDSKGKKRQVSVEKATYLRQWQLKAVVMELRHSELCYDSNNDVICVGLFFTLLNNYQL